MLTTYLDVDEIATGGVESVPEPARYKAVAGIDRIDAHHGTTVVWERCDRLDNRRVSTLVRRIGASLGRIFRSFLLRGVRIEINGVAIKPVDPLFLEREAVYSGARQFQSMWVCEVYANPQDDASAIGKVEVIFSELPVDAWHDLSNDCKRDRGIANGAGVSIVRAGREVDYGWFFMGAKRRENYDDWWRCEVRFDPVLDEAFGITHTKQQIRPKDYLTEATHLELVRWGHHRPEMPWELRGSASAHARSACCRRSTALSTSSSAQRRRQPVLLSASSLG